MAAANENELKEIRVVVERKPRPGASKDDLRAIVKEAAENRRIVADCKEAFGEATATKALLAAARFALRQHEAVNADVEALMRERDMLRRRWKALRDFLNESIDAMVGDAP